MVPPSDLASAQGMWEHQPSCGWATLQQVMWGWRAWQEEEEAARAKSPRSNGTVCICEVPQPRRINAIAFVIKMACGKVKWIKDLL